MTNVCNTIATATPMNAAGAEAQMASEAEPSADSLPPVPYPLVRAANARMVNPLTFFSGPMGEISLSNNNSDLEFSLGG